MSSNLGGIFKTLEESYVYHPTSIWFKLSDYGHIGSIRQH